MRACIFGSVLLCVACSSGKGAVRAKTSGVPFKCLNSETLGALKYLIMYDFLT